MNRHYKSKQKISDEIINAMRIMYIHGVGIMQISKVLYISKNTIANHRDIAKWDDEKKLVCEKVSKAIEDNCVAFQLKFWSEEFEKDIKKINDDYDGAKRSTKTDLLQCKIAYAKLAMELHARLKENKELLEQAKKLGEEINEGIRIAK